jgi:hypothetical protein
MARSIQSPGVEIFEKDLSLSPVLPAGTNIFMAGFAPKGPTDEIFQITSVQEFEQVYGTPTNPAERYFYYGARQVLNSSNGNLFVSRMPYGTGNGEGYGSTYGALVYPVVAVTETSDLIYRNVDFIDKSYFAASEVAASINLNPTLSGRLTNLQNNGINTYSKFTTAEYASLNTGFNNFYTANVGTNPTLANEFISQLAKFSQAPETVVSTSLTAENCTYVLGAPKFFELSHESYQGILDNSSFTNSNQTWSTSSVSIGDINSVADFGKAGLIVLNKIQSTINGRYEGHYVGLADNSNILPNTDYDGICKVYTNNTKSVNGVDISQMVDVPFTKLSFSLSAVKDSSANSIGGSISETLEKVAFSFTDLATDKFDDVLTLGLFKLRTSPYNPDAVQLDYLVEESATGSLDYHRQINSQTGGPAKTFYLENILGNSNNVTMLVNKHINSKDRGPWLDINNIPKKQVRVFSRQIEKNLKQNLESNYIKYGYHLNDVDQINNYMDYADALFPIGTYSSFSSNDSTIGSLTLKLDRTLRKLENDEVFDLDLVAEAGLGTIYATVCANRSKYFDDTELTSGLQNGLLALTQNEYTSTSEDADNLKENYSAVFQLFDNFCSKLRKDCLFVADPLRQIFITGANRLTTADVNKPFSQNVYNPLRNLYSTANSSYACVYANWAKVNDIYSGMNIWVPFSPFAVADMANVDQNFEPWYAPAGFTRGKVTNALALAITPKQKERDQLYRISMNPVAFFPNDGFNIFGQKTLLRQPSAFDRINVRRLFLYLEKATKKTTKYFIFEPNTLFTRNRVKAVLNPIFERAKNTQGLTDYIIVCDKNNNTPTVIDQNELVVDIYLKPVRAAEFILVNFYATSTGTNFNEIIGA